MKVVSSLSLFLLFLTISQGSDILSQPCPKHPRGKCIDMDKTYCPISYHYAPRGCPSGEYCCSKYVEKTPKYKRGKDQCGVPIRNVESGNKIVGGKRAKLENFPWMVSVHEHEFHVCGGSIISDRWILTAAHCVVGADEEDITVLTGTPWSYPKHVDSREIENIYIHGSFVKDKEDEGYDIALLKLKKPLSLGAKNQRRICLPGKNETFGDRICVATGWGSVVPTDGSFYSKDVTDLLKRATLPVRNHKECEYFEGKLPDGIICAGHEIGGEDTCLGDSGGPLVCQDKQGYWKQAGIVSTGDGCAQEAAMALYTEVAHYIDWIEKIINDY